MNYLYYPGCSLKGNGKGYEESILAVFGALGAKLTELEDWNCCGATAYMAVNELKAFALSARNLAIAEKHAGKRGTIDLIAPCAACYLVLSKTQRYLSEYSGIADKIHQSLYMAGLEYNGRVRVRHPLDVLVNDIGVERIRAEVKEPLSGMKFACYYGCQIIRPFATFDDQHNPSSMNKIVHALGGETVEWALKTRCCGGSLIGTVPEVGIRLSFILLKEAKACGADSIITACPLCQFNLECYQGKMRKEYGEKIDMPVAYFSQIMGMAMGLKKRDLGMHRLFVPPKAHKGATKGAQNVAK
jgi:heterodisulfide reductase subunit B